MKTTYKNCILTSLFSAIIAVLSLITIPTPTGIPFTLQTFAVAFCGYFLGVPYCLVSVLIYIGLGIVGLPVFSGFGAGFPVLFGPTGGFLWGFLLLTFCCGLFKNRGFFAKFICGILGILLCHTVGILQFKLIYGVNIITAVLSVSLPYILKDILSVTAAYGLANLINKRIKIR